MEKAEQPEKIMLNVELDPALATAQKLRKYGNVKMPAVPLPYIVSTSLVADDANVRVWVHKQNSRTFIIADISEDVTNIVGGKQKRERGIIKKKTTEGKDL